MYIKYVKMVEQQNAGAEEPVITGLAQVQAALEEIGISLTAETWQNFDALNAFYSNTNLDRLDDEVTKVLEAHLYLLMCDRVDETAEAVVAVVE